LRAIVLLAALGMIGAANAQAPPLVLPIVFHVPSSGGVPLADEAWLAARVSRANAIFTPHDIAFSLEETAPLPDELRQIETRRDRDRLARHARPGSIDCYLVESLKDVDIPDRYIRGVHWRSRTNRARHYIILSISGGSGVLAHELGHFLGNPQHRWVPGNVMSYEWGDQTPSFDPDQVLRMRRFLERALRQRSLVPVE